MDWMATGPPVGKQQPGEEGRAPPTADGQRTTPHPPFSPTRSHGRATNLKNQQKFPEKYKTSTLVKEETETVSRPNHQIN